MPDWRHTRSAARASPWLTGCLVGLALAAVWVLLRPTAEVRHSRGTLVEPLGSGKAASLQPPLLAGRSSSPTPPGRESAVWPALIRVESERGETVAGATLYYAARSDLSVNEQQTVLYTSSDAGLAAIPQPPQGKEVLLVTRSGHLPVSMQVQVLAKAARQAGGEAIPVRLGRGGSITGFVHDADGRGIEGARVFALGRLGMDLLAESPHARGGPQTAASLTSSTTDWRGRFAIDGIGDFPVEVWAVHDSAIHAHGGAPPRATHSGAHVDVAMAHLCYADVCAKDRHSDRTLRIHRLDVTWREDLMSPIAGPSGLGLRPDASNPLELTSGWSEERRSYRLVFLIRRSVGPDLPMPTVVAKVPGFVQSAAVPLETLAHAMDVQRPAAPTLVHMSAVEDPDLLGSVRLVVRVAGADVAPSVAHYQAARLSPAGSPAQHWSGSVSLRSEGGGDGAIARGRLDLPSGSYDVSVSLSHPLPAITERVRVGPGHQHDLPVVFRAGRIRVVATQQDGSPLGEYNVQVFALPPSHDVAASAGQSLVPLFVATRSSWLNDPRFAEARRQMRGTRGVGDILLAPGAYRLHVSKPGCESAWVDVDLQDAQRLEETVVLRPLEGGAR